MDWTPVIDSLAGLGPFVVYVGLSLGMIAVYASVYMMATAHDELGLIRRGNPAAAIAFAGSLLGYTRSVRAVPRSGADRRSGHSSVRRRSSHLCTCCRCIRKQSDS